MWELYCPGCGTLIEAEVCAEGEPPAHDIRLGATSDLVGEPF
jgi:acetone carboxylase gamma subunit